MEGRSRFVEIFSLDQNLEETERKQIMIPDIHKTVIVTGASQGIEAGLVKAFLDRRYNVVATSRSITKTGGVKAANKLELVDGNLSPSSNANRNLERNWPTHASAHTRLRNRPLALIQ